MGASVLGAWLLKGHFDFADQDQHNTTTLSVKASLCDALGLQPDGLRIANYPTGPSFKHTFWWRESETDYAEAQFVAAISKEHPVLSLARSYQVVEAAATWGASRHRPYLRQTQRFVVISDRGDCPAQR